MKKEGNRRLTEELRHSIRNAVLDGVLKKRQEALSVEEDALGQLVYDRIYEPIIQSRMKDLPDEFFYRKSTVYARIDGTGLFAELTMKTPRPVAAADGGSYQRPLFKFTEENGITTRLRKYLTDKAQFSKDRRALRDHAYSLLKGCVTVKQLCERWPEGEVYFKEVLGSEPITNPPVVTADGLRNIIANLGG